MMIFFGAKVLAGPCTFSLRVEFHCQDVGEEDHAAPCPSPPAEAYPEFCERVFFQLIHNEACPRSGASPN